jgi:hypothetical protein
MKPLISIAITVGIIYIKKYTSIVHINTSQIATELRNKMTF